MASVDARLDFRLPSQLKDLIQQAAAIRGQSVTDYAISTLSENARRVVQLNSLTVLSDRDRDLFLKILDSDAEPNDALRRAAQRYKEHNAPRLESGEAGTGS